jgi:hypothetical protein
VTREQRISLLHELVEHAVVHRRLRADLHELVREIPRDHGLLARVLEEGPTSARP